MKTLTAFSKLLAQSLLMFSMVLAINVQAQDVDDATLLNEVSTALPAGTTLENATADQISLAVQTVVAARGNAAAARVLDAVTIFLDDNGLSAIADSVTDSVVDSLPEAERAAVRNQVTRTRSRQLTNLTRGNATTVQSLIQSGGAFVDSQGRVRSVSNFADLGAAYAFVVQGNANYNAELIGRNTGVTIPVSPN